MRIFIRIIIALITSQALSLGVFAVSEWYIVVRESDTMCGDFIPGNASSPNWLSEDWSILGMTPLLAQQFRLTPSCESGTLANCCRDNGYRYAGTPIWASQVSESRRAAEFLASRGIIERHNLNPSAYRLSETVTRREMMKIISEVANLAKVDCKRIFSDVDENDWWCPYIESSLERGFITRNNFFRPDDTLTQTEALKLIFEARGIEKRYTTNFWQQDYISTAVYLWYIDEKYSDYNIVWARWWVFQVLARSYREEFQNW